MNCYIWIFAYDTGDVTQCEPEPGSPSRLAILRCKLADLDAMGARHKFLRSLTDARTRHIYTSEYNLPRMSARRLGIRRL